MIPHIPRKGGLPFRQTSLFYSFAFSLRSWA